MLSTLPWLLATVDLGLLLAFWTQLAQLLRTSPSLSSTFRRYMLEHSVLSVEAATSASANQVGGLMLVADGLLALWLSISLSLWLPDAHSLLCTLVHGVRWYLRRQWLWWRGDEVAAVMLLSDCQKSTHKMDTTTMELDPFHPTLGTFGTWMFLASIWIRSILVALLGWIVYLNHAQLQRISTEITYQPTLAAMDASQLASLLSLLQSMLLLGALALANAWWQQNLAFYQLGSIPSKSG